LENFGWCLLPLYLLFIGLSVLWVLSDAEERTNAGCAISLLVAISWPFGLVVWLLFRPKKHEANSNTR
jgi:hypothetical protein